mgnify:CR=1 FL=1
MKTGISFNKTINNCCFTSSYLLEEARNVEVNPSAVAEEINGLIVDGKVQQEGTKIFENSLYFAEDGIRKSLTALTNRSGKDFADEKLLTVLAEVERDLEITYDDLQKQAIIGAMNQQFFILTGKSIVISSKFLASM